jgi:hypothetical protein
MIIIEVLFFDNNSTMVAIALDIIYFDRAEKNNFFHNFLSSSNIFDNNYNSNDVNKNNSSFVHKSNEKNLLIIFNLFCNKIKRIFISNCRIVDCLALGKNETFLLACSLCSF